MSTAEAVKSAPPPSRMSLRNVSKGKIIQPKHVVLYGVEGIGKSTFAANAPKPLRAHPLADRPCVPALRQ